MPVECKWRVVSIPENSVRVIRENGAWPIIFSDTTA